MKKLNRNQQSVIPRLLESSARGATRMRMFFMLMIMMMTSAFAMAQETYGIKIAGEDITGYNRYDLTDISGVSGTVYFDPNTRTLTLDNATIEAKYDNAILNETCDYLTIELIGTNTIDVTGAAGIDLKEETTIWSNSGGKLSVKSNLCAVLFRGCPLEISNCWLEAEGEWGISANNNVAEEVLTIRNSHVEAKGSTGSICDIAGLVLDYCSIKQPDGALFSTKNKAVVLNDEMVTDKVVIEPYYGIKIAGVDVTKKNCKDLSGIDGVDGKMSYDPETKTLTMEDVTLNPAYTIGIQNKDVEGLKIKLVGNNTITAKSVCITINKTSTISGSGNLRLKSIYSPGINMFSSLTVENIKLYAEGPWGIAGNNGKSGEILTLRNAYVETTGKDCGSFIDLQNLVLDGCAITQPVGAAFDANVHAVALNGKEVTDKVVIAPDNLGFEIAGEKVTRKNCKDLSVIKGVSGNVSYDPNTKTLTLDNATITNEDEGYGKGIVNKNISDFTIRLIGENTVTTGSASLVLNQPSTITGEGSLSLSSQKYCGLDMEAASVLIDNTKLFVRGAYGIAGYMGAETEVLTVRNSYVEAEGFALGSIVFLSNLILEDCAITQPDGAEFDAQKKAVVLNGEEIKSKVVIAPVANGISDITTGVPAHAKGIYSVTGVKQTQQWNELPAGIYIVDGVKRVKR